MLNLFLCIYITRTYFDLQFLTALLGFLESVWGVSFGIVISHCGFTRFLLSRRQFFQLDTIFFYTIFFNSLLLIIINNICVFSCVKGFFQRDNSECTGFSAGRRDALNFVRLPNRNESQKQLSQKSKSVSKWNGA